MLSLPRWIWGGQFEGLLSSAGLRHHRSGPAGRDGLYAVSTQEQYLRASRAGLLVAAQILGPGSREDFSTLQRLEAAQSNIDSSTVVDLQALLDEAFPSGEQEAVGGRQAIAHTMARIQMHTAGTVRADLPSAISQARDALLNIRITGSGQSAFPDVAVHAVSRSSQLALRFKLAAICLRLQHDSKLRDGGPDVLAGIGGQDIVFGSSHELVDGVYLFDAYLAPLFGSLAPFMWAFPASRGGVTVVYTLGRALSATDGLPAEPLQAISFRGADKVTETPRITSDSCSSALRWWIETLDAFMAVVSDPAVYTDRAGVFRPDKQLYALLSVEQVFRRVATLQRSHRDKDARRVAFFSVMDTLERLTGRTLTVMCRPTFARQVFEQLRGSMPPAAQDILLPACDRAIDALRELTDGFFLPRQRGRDTVDYVDEGGRTQELSLEEATAQYVKLLRDATHGFGGKANVRRGEALLVQHNGHVPHDLALLGWLHLLNLINRPDRLRLGLWRGGAV